MSTYAIGDIHGCDQSLDALLEKINYTPAIDSLWFTGDLVGRGPYPLDVLQRLKSMSEMNSHLVIVLGNHDLHLISLALGILERRPEFERDPTLTEILELDAEDPTLLDWLRGLPLLHHDEQLDSVLIHAGIPHIWSLDMAKQQASAVERILRLPRSQLKEILPDLYGNEPSGWDDCSTPTERARLTINYLTRMRFCDKQGNLDLGVTGRTHPNKNFSAWFSYPPRVQQRQIFGHWRALRGETAQERIWGMDYGCVLGDGLAARRLEDGKFYFVPAVEPQPEERAILRH